MKFVIIGLSLSSSWGNGHATTYRALLKELAKLGHSILFLEKDVPWYAPHRDLPAPTFCTLELYTSNEQLKATYAREVEEADIVIVGSYVQQGVEVGEWVVQTAKGVTAFYDIDTPVTLAKLKRQDFEYLNPELISKYDLYLSFSGGPILKFLENTYNSPKARALYCSVDPDLYFPENIEKIYKMGYLGTYSPDRQPTVQELLNKPAAGFKKERFVVAGPQYPENITWSSNIERIEHLPPAAHRQFYNQQEFTLNVTRDDMIAAGYSPSVRLFEAAACGVPIISDYWDGIHSIFERDTEILIARSSSEVEDYFRNIDEQQRKQIGERAHKKVLQYHTAAARARELVQYVREVKEQPHQKV